MIVLLIICCFVLVLGFACWGIYLVLFTGNERFILRQVELTGLDPDRAGAMTRYLKITPNKDNLFNINLADVRRKVEKISYIKDARISRILPDTLKIAVTQRVPLAYLLKYNSLWVIDEDSIVMNRKYCMKLKYSLPVITGIKRRKFNVGEKLAGLKQAIELIKFTTYDFQNFKVCSIDIADERKLVFVMIKKRSAYKVLILRKNMKDMLCVLRDALRNKRGEHKATIDLTYNNLVIFR